MCLSPMYWTVIFLATWVLNLKLYKGCIDLFTLLPLRNFAFFKRRFLLQYMASIRITRYKEHVFSGVLIGIKTEVYSEYWHAIAQLTLPMCLSPMYWTVIFLATWVLNLKLYKGCIDLFTLLPLRNFAFFKRRFLLQYMASIRITRYKEHVFSGVRKMFSLTQLTVNVYTKADEWCVSAKVLILQVLGSQHGK